MARHPLIGIDDNVIVYEIEADEKFGNTIVDKKTEKKNDAFIEKYCEEKYFDIGRCESCGVPVMGNSKYGVYVESLHGEYKRVVMTARHCQRCQNVQLYGHYKTVFPLIHSMIAALPSAPRNPDDAFEGITDEFVIQNTETGEVEPADDLMKAMLGEKWEEGLEKTDEK